MYPSTFKKYLVLCGRSIHYRFVLFQTSSPCVCDITELYLFTYIQVYVCMDTFICSLKISHVEISFLLPCG